MLTVMQFGNKFPTMAIMFKHERFCKKGLIGGLLEIVAATCPHIA